MEKSSKEEKNKYKYFIQKGADSVKTTIYGGNGYNEDHVAGPLLKSDEFGKFGTQVGISNSILKTTISLSHLNDKNPIPADPTLRMCSRVFRLKKGDIIFSGIQKFSVPSNPGEEAELAIVGGTKKYKNISGYLKMKVLAAEKPLDKSTSISPLNVLLFISYKLN